MIQMLVVTAVDSNLSVSLSVSPLQQSAEGKSPRTQDRFSLRTTPMTTDRPKSVCGGSPCPRDTTSGSASRPSR